jgi:hypothetical protein
MRHISNQDGFVLVVGLILMTVLATIVLGSFAVSITEVQVSSNYRSSVQAVALAEGVLAQVIYWFNNPSAFTDTTVTYHASTPTAEKGANFFTRRRAGGRFFSTARLSQFYDVLGNGTVVTSSASPALEYKSSNAAQKTFLDNTFNVVSAAGNITNIKLFGSSNPEEVALVQVTAQSKGGGTATIEAVLGPTPGGSGIANGIEVGGAAGFFGNAVVKVHLSNAVIVGNADFGNPNDDGRPPQLTCDTTLLDQPNEKEYGPGAGRNDDPWVLVKVGGIVTLGGVPYNWNDSAALAAAYTGKHKNILPGRNNDPDTTNNVSISKISYDDAKVVAKKSKFYKGSTAFDSYYYTKSGSANKDNIYDIAGTQYTFTDRIDGITKGTIFVDTTDQKIPNNFPIDDPMSNLQDLSISGAISFKGTMLLAANLKTSGLGPGTNFNVQSPPWKGTLLAGCPDYPLVPSYCSEGASRPMCATAAGDRQPVTNLKLNLRGLVYVFGQMEVVGDPKIFGALITERGFKTAGTPEIWFDYDLKDGNPSVPWVFIRSWREVGST